MNSADFARGDLCDDPCAHLFAGQFQVLADVGEALVADRVGVVGDDRDARRERLFDRRVERVQVDQRDRDARPLSRRSRVFIALTIWLTLLFSEPVHW